MAAGRDPLAPDVVVVQGPGMERWIAQSIARDYGICANMGFPFPRDFIERVFRALPDKSLAKPNSSWDVRNLTWRIAKRLAEGRDDPDFAPLAYRAREALLRCLPAAAVTALSRLKHRVVIARRRNARD